MPSNPKLMQTRAGRSPTFWTGGPASIGLAGTRELASPLEELLSFKTSPSLSIMHQQNQRCVKDSTPTPSNNVLWTIRSISRAVNWHSRVQGLASPGWTRESQLSSKLQSVSRFKDQILARRFINARCYCVVILNHHSRSISCKVHK